MLTAEIICVGTELLMGQVINTNGAHIAQGLSECGIAVNYSSVVGDNPQRLADAVRVALDRCDILVTTGGLGPTDDDLTKEIIAEVMGKELVFHEPSMEKMLAYLKDAGKNMSKNNEKQAYLPKDCIVLDNDNGTAPGCIMEDKNKWAVLLPGPPKEMKPMFKKATEHLKKISGVIMKSRVVRVFGIGESRAAALLDDLIKEQTNPTIAPYAKEGEVTFRITASGESEAEVDAMLEDMAEKVYGRIGEYIYGEGDDNSLAEVVVKALSEKSMSVATCESCTGGLIGQMLTRVPGASEVFKFGFITYSNQAKEQLAGVKRDTLDKYTAVSEAVAMEMAEGTRRRTNADIAVSVTGYAGPTGENVGLVYVGISDKNGCEAYRFMQTGDRERIRKKSALCALDLVRRRING